MTIYEVYFNSEFILWANVMHKKKQITEQEQKEVCYHVHGFHYNGPMPLTGQEVCNICGVTIEEAHLEISNQESNRKKTLTQALSLLLSSWPYVAYINNGSMLSEQIRKLLEQQGVIKSDYFGDESAAIEQKED